MIHGESESGDIEIIERKTVFQGFYRLDSVHLRHRQFDGSMGPEISRELFVRPPAVGVLIIDPETSDVLLIEQFRVGAMADKHPWQIEVVAGLVEPGESLEAVAIRETVEEAGVAISELEKVFEFMPSAGGSDERFTLFVAPANLSRAGGVHGVKAEGENIRVTVVSINQAMQWLAQGRINNAPCMLAVQWYAANRDRLKKKWGK
jgi:ADP-ribose pyrophosphatase